jgi:hypothetical protein
VSVPAENNSTTNVTNSNVIIALNDDIIDLYSMEPEECMKAKERPFVHYISLHSKKGEITRTKALFDGGAMVAAMCASFFHCVKHRLGSWKPSYRQLRMANGVIIRSQAKWKGVIELGNIRIEGEFEVFNSDGGWDFLFGKPLLRASKAVHDYKIDVVTITDPTTRMVSRLRNQGDSRTPGVKCKRKFQGALRA